MKVILDCNIWISFLVGHQKELVKRILTDMRFDVYVCHQLLREIDDVASRSKIRKYIGAADVGELKRIIAAFCQYAEPEREAVSDIRDAKDLYLLSLAETIGATYIVSGDKDLTDLRSHKGTDIIKLSEFKTLMLYI